MATITYKGFADVDAATMVQVKKQIGNFEQKELYGQDCSLILTLKKIHSHDGKGGKAEIHAQLESKKVHHAEAVDFSVPAALESVLKKVAVLFSKENL